MEGSLSLDREGRIIRFSSDLAEMLGFGAEDVIGKDLSVLAPQGKGSALKKLLDAASRGARVTGRETDLRRKDDTAVAVYLSVYPLRYRTGKVYSYMVSVGTEKTAEVPAILTEEFQRIFRFSNDAVTVTDRDGCVIDVNRAFLNLYGYTREEVLGRNPRKLKSEHSTTEMYERMWGDILDPEKGFWRGEIINLRKDGKEVPVLLSINVIKNSAGEIKNFLGIAFNMTDQKELDKINNMYIDYIVHDLRGPLTSVAAYAERLLKELDGKIPAPSRRKLEIIRSSSHKMEDMATDILNFSRARAGALPLRKEKTYLNDLLKAAVTPFEDSGKKILVNGSAYRGSIAEDRRLNVDPGKIHRVIYNLVSNAVKHSSSEVRVEYKLEDGKFTLTVTDDGAGITAEEAERIFDAFYQTEEGIKTGGAGLGLSIVKSFVEAHEGSVWARPGKGATFGFSIPA